MSFVAIGWQSAFLRRPFIRPHKAVDFKSTLPLGLPVPSSCRLSHYQAAGSTCTWTGLPPGRGKNATGLDSGCLALCRPQGRGRKSGSGQASPARVYLAASSQPFLQASVLGTSAVAVVALIAIAGIIVATGSSPDFRCQASSVEATTVGDHETQAMATDMPPGRPGNLTPDQEEKLRKLWSLILQLCRVGGDDSGNVTDSVTSGAGYHSSAPPAESKSETPKKKKKMSMFGRKRGESEADTPAAPDHLEGNLRNGGDQDDKYGQTKQFYDTLASQSPESIRATMWSMVKHDNPDALLLRFLRARKWDVDKALIMLISTMNWRAMEMHVDDDIMKNGEGGAALAEREGDAEARRMGQDFLAQMRMGKSFLHGSDRVGRPICFVRVRLHRQGEHLEKALERNTVYLIETARLLLKPPVDTATIIFDMTGFSMANMDYTPVKFMIRCFEANYPESLGAILVYKSPWIFQGIWKVIRGWLDPVVASKVHFLNTAKEMEQFVDLDRLPKEVDGKSSWEYKYVEPVEGENAKMSDTATRDCLLEAREKLVEAYEHATLEWLKGPDEEKTAAITDKRNAIAIKLRDDYWNLDPYLRARSLYDRICMIKPGGEVDLHSEEKAVQPNGQTCTFDDDVD